MESSERVGTARGPLRPASLSHKSSLKPEDVHVLLVDDERLSRTIVSNLLRRCNYTVTTAENGAEAMEMLRESAPGTFQLVLTDVCMPEVDGIQLLEYVKSEDALRSVPVIMMSSIEKGDTVYQCVQGGAEEYLVKPVTRKEVQHMWQHVLRKRSVAATVPQAPLAAAHAAAQEADAGPFLAIAPAAAEDERHEGSSAEALPSPVNQSAAQPKSALRSPAPPKSPQVPSKEDLGATCQFLQLMRSTHMEEMAALKQQVAALEADAALVAAGLRASMESQGSGCLSTPSGEEPASKRQRCGVATDPRTCSQHTPQVGAHPIAGRLKELESVYFGRRHAGGERHYLEGFARDLNVLARGKTLTQVATLRAGDIASPQEMVCCADFDADDRFFATVSVSRSVKVFDFDAVLAAPSVLHFPAWQATTRSKLSSVSWNSYIRSHLVTADYDGLIQLWDAAGGPGAEAAQFDEHARRVWSLDFSTIDPMRFVSGSDDATVRLWNVNQDASVMRLTAPANVCSVQFSPTDGNLLAAGCANHRVYLFDIRNPGAPAATIAGPGRAVSYVRFVGGAAVAAASTDSTVRVWGVEEALQAANGPHAGCPLQPRTVLTGHKNDRNFVGLSANADGFIASGSEDNTLHLYSHTLPFSIAQHSLGSGEGTASAGGSSLGGFASKSKHRPFVSAVSWARNSRRCLVANSEGLLRVLHLQ